MTMALEQLDSLLKAQEGEVLEFKEAKNNYCFDELVKYCAAIANEGGGKFVLGVTDKRPRQVVGTKAFEPPERTRYGLIEKLHLNITFDVIEHPRGRVLIFHIPPRPVGMPISPDGKYWQRESDSLVPMTADRLRAVFAESGHDFSADICPGLTIDDLDPRAIENFRKQWIAKSKNNLLMTLSSEQLLSDAGAVVDGQCTYASLILFGTRKAVGKHLAQAETIFEYRSSNAPGPAQQREEFRQGFFTYHDRLWELINARNDVQHFQSGLFILDIPTFSEHVIREALLNAVSHRDYQLAGSVFVRQYPRQLRLENPGGFPVGVNEKNILHRQSPRNRRIADIFSKCGLVERSGQGMDLMFRTSIRESKHIPDFSGTDQYQVTLTLDGEVHDPQFLVFLEKVGREKQEMFCTDDFLVLDLVHREQTVSEHLHSRLQPLMEAGAIERYGRGRGIRYILARAYYTMINQKGVYTRKRGLDRRTNKELLLKHIRDNEKTGSRLKELCQVLPALSRPQVQTLLQELKSDGKIVTVGKTRNSLWYPSNSADPIAAEIEGK
ncbi:MAG: putative DNA binding domain-containing protein [Phycisphaerae bacterium]|nr:putative DNA binding domain-containing protein [Phycisphaerae bacterium]